MAEPLKEHPVTEEEAAGPGPKPPRKRHKHWGRRKRRLRRAAWSLAVLAVAGAVAVIWTYRAGRPETWRPGEDLDEITENLARGLPAEAPRPALADVTDEAGLGGFRTFAGERSSQLPEDMGSGAAWGDFDGDGDDDLFLVAAGGPLTADPTAWAPSTLYENLGDGTFRESRAFPGLQTVGMAAAWGDADGDGRLDLVVTGYGTLALFHNEEGRLVRDETFPPLETGSRGFWAGAAWGDFDNDRDLDLYVTGYVRYVEDPNAREQVSRQYGHAVPYTLNPVSFEPERNLLFRNDGAGGFTEVARELGVANPEGRSLGALWHDFDDDGRLDLYVANDVSDNALYLNRSDGPDRFEDAGLAAWVADYRGAMGLAAGDYDRDGDDDLFVTHWIAQENALYDSLLADVKARDAAAAAEGGRTGPALPAGIGFSDLAAPLGLGQTALRFVGWGTEFVDLDADGWLDLVVANGSTFERKDDPTRLEPQVPQLLWNQQGEHFHDLAPANELLIVPHVGRGLAVSDYDGDGEPDLAIVQHGEGVQLLRNDMATGRSISLRLVSRTANGELLGFGDGAKVTARIGDGEDEVLLRRTVGGASYLSQSSRTLHFGLGKADRVDEIQVRWLGGGTDVYRDLEAGALWELREGDPTPHRIGERRVGLGPPGAGDGADDPLPTDPRERTLAFWQAHRAGMDAIKKERDPEKAEPLFRRALALDPEHEDARYYLAAALAARGETEEALEHLRELARLNPQSHRAFKRWGTLEARIATSPAELDEATRALERALELNQEETGSLLILGELALLQGDPATAQQRLKWACDTNPKAVGGFFLRGYVAWKEGDREAAVALLEQARAALGPEWKPEGTVAEGDTKQTMHEEESPLARFWRTWDGEPDPATAFAALEDFLTRFRS